MKTVEIRPNCVIGVSGGADSMFLLHQYRNAENIHVVHVNYGVRDDADLDEQLVRDFCTEHNIPFHCKKVLFDTSSNFESKARDFRYNLFIEIKTGIGLDHIVTAHNANDQAETLLMRILRGTGLRGLSCIHKDDGLLFRPLLGWKKSEIYDKCNEYNIPYREDTTNQDVYYLRNWFRHKYDVDSMVDSASRITDNIQQLLPKLELMAATLYEHKIFIKDGNIWISKDLEPDMLFHMYLTKFMPSNSLTFEVCERMFSDDPSTRHFNISSSIRCNKRKKDWIIVEIG